MAVAMMGFAASSSSRHNKYIYTPNSNRSSKSSKAKNNLLANKASNSASSNSKQSDDPPKQTKCPSNISEASITLNIDQEQKITPISNIDRLKQFIKTNLITKFQRQNGASEKTETHKEAINRLMKRLDTPISVFFILFGIAIPLIRLGAYSKGDNYFPYSLIRNATKLNITVSSEYQLELDTFLLHFCFYWILMQFVTFALVFVGIYTKCRKLLYPYLWQTCIEFTVFAFLVVALFLRMPLYLFNQSFGAENMFEDIPMLRKLAGYMSKCFIGWLGLIAASACPTIWYGLCIKYVTGELEEL